MKNQEIFSISSVLKKCIENIEDNTMENALTIRNVWKDILCSIRGPAHSLSQNPIFLGEKLYSHTRIIDLEHEVLLIEVDHSGWIQTLQFYNTYILRGLKKKIPELRITSIAYRLKGSDFEIKSVNKEISTKSEESKEEFISITIKDTLPDELKEKFEKLKKLSEKK